MRLRLILLAVVVLGLRAFAQPLPPSVPVPAPLSFSPGRAAAAESYTINTASRAETRHAYRSLFAASEDVSIGWTGGSYTAPYAPGSTSDDHKQAVVRRINWFRAMAGVPAGITLDAVYSAKAQQAAMIMSVKNDLSHFPPNSWPYWTQDGYDAAGSSNLSLGVMGPEGIVALMRDAGANNLFVGHRRWFLYPQTRVMGAGDVPGDGTGAFRAAQAVWIFDNYYGTARPTTRDDFVAWPNKGYVPHTMVFPRWSFSYPGADFSGATVAVKRDNTTISTQIEANLNPPEYQYGENTIVFKIARYGTTNTIESTGDHPRPSADVTYAVTIDNVIVNGTPRSFSYNVIVFDPDVVGAGDNAVTLSGPASITNGQSSSYSVQGPSFASSLQWRAFSTAAFATVYGAESGLEGLVADVSPNYSPRWANVSGAGNVYHLTHYTNYLSDQFLAIPGLFYVPTSGTRALNFKSSLRYAADTQTAKVQVSYDDGASWGDLWTYSHASGSGSSSFSDVSIDLSPLAGRTVKFRFAYVFRMVNGSGSYYAEQVDSPSSGWYFDAIALPGLQSASVSLAPRTAEAGNFVFTPSGAGSLYLQGGARQFSLFDLEWGVSKAVTVAPFFRVANFSVRGVSDSSASPLTLGFWVAGGSRNLLVRSIGPALKPFGVTDAVDDSVLNVYGSGALLLAGNDNWGTGNITLLQAAFASTYAFSLPTDSKDAATLVSVSEGGRNAQGFSTTQTGVVLVEAYALEDGQAGRIVNFSANNFAGSGTNVLILGFSIVGDAPVRLLIRAVGSELNTLFQVPGAIGDTRLEIYNSQEQVIYSNEEWDSSSPELIEQAATEAYAGFQLVRGSHSSALVVTLNPGVYTAQLKGANAATGQGLVEAYVLP